MEQTLDCRLFGPSATCLGQVLPPVLTGKVLSKHAYSLELWCRGGLDLVQDHTILPLRGVTVHISPHLKASCAPQPTSPTIAQASNTMCISSRQPGCHTVPAAVAGDMCQQCGDSGYLLCPTFPHLADLFLAPMATSGATCPLLCLSYPGCSQTCSNPPASAFQVLGITCVSPCPVGKVTPSFSMTHTEHASLGLVTHIL